ncbi:MAG: hypothetical protein OEX07_13165 [Gammaproteobacteria bacterium]|nr:hypothetical protein [Gammaproteobacteria bacterium]
MKIWKICIVSLVFGFAVTSNSFAEPHAGHGDGSGDGMKNHHDMSKKHAANKHKKGGTFSPHWVKTLTDEQKISFDKMHLAVGQFEAVQRAKMKMLKAELNVLAAARSNNKTAIYEKIDEILSVKKMIMRNRFDHIAEMRGELTDQQQISYDMGLLKRGEHKH